MNVKWQKNELQNLYRQHTLEEIGKLYGVTRERMRQVFNELGIPRRCTGTRKLRSLAEYLAGNDLGATMRTYLPPGIVCAECGTNKKLHIHHIVYLARNIADIQVLCASCHHYKHRTGRTFSDMLSIYQRFLNGERQTALAKEYGVSPVSICHLIKRMRNRVP